MSRRRESRRRLKSSLWALILIAMLLIFSSYAWFSANRVVTIDGIQAKVSAAEGLQISLDGEKWESNITLSEEALSALGKDINNYNWPGELRPVSTDGHFDSGNFVMYSGEVSSDGSYLTNPGTNTADFISFDLYFKNASSQEAGDILQLNTGSMVQVTNEALREKTGLEYSARVGMLLYDSSELMTAEPATIRALAAGTAPKSSIWEPNYNKHITEVVTNDSRISAADSVFKTLALKSITTTNKDGVPVIDGINASEVGSNENLAVQNTMQTDANLQAAQNMKDTSNTDVMLKPNAVMKARIYIWLEGQDPDCIDTATTGQSLDFALSFTKPTATQSEP